MGCAQKKNPYAALAVPLAPTRIPIRRLLTPSIMSVTSIG